METPNNPIDKLKQIFQDDTPEEEKKSIEELFDAEYVEDTKEVKLIDKREHCRNQDTMGRINRMNMQTEIVKLDINLLVPNPQQGRFGYEDGFFSENTQELLKSRVIQKLAESIEANGLLQPIVVSPVRAKKDGKLYYVVLFGHQRVLAHILLGKTEIRAIIGHIDNNGYTKEEYLLKNISENMARSDFNPMEVSLILEKLMHLQSLRSIGNKIGIDEAQLCRMAKLTNLHKKIQKSLLTKDYKKKDTRALYHIAQLPHEEQQYYFDEYQKGELTRSQLKKIVDDKKNGGQIKNKSRYISAPVFKSKSVKDFIQSQEDFATKFDEWLSHFLQERGFDFETLKKSKTKKDTSNKTKTQDNAPADMQQVALFDAGANESSESQA